MMFTSPTPPDFTLERYVPSAPGQVTSLNDWTHPRKTQRSNNSVLPEAPNEIVVGFLTLK